MGAAILKNIVSRSKDSTLFREISLEIFVVFVGRTATCVGFREISREMSWPNAALITQVVSSSLRTPLTLTPFPSNEIVQPQYLYCTGRGML